MDRDVQVKQFANALFSYVFKDYNTHDLPIKLPQRFNLPEASDFCEEFGKAVLKMCRTYSSSFNVVFTKEFSQIKRSVKHFMTYLTSRCLKLCGDDLFLSLIIICAFIAELNRFCCVNGCYTFIYTAPKCLIAIFNRRLKNEFYSCGGWEVLKEFCEQFVQQNGNNSSDYISAPSPGSVQSMLELLGDESSSEEESSESEPSSLSEGEMSHEESTPAALASVSAQSTSHEDVESSEDSESSISEDKDSDSESDSDSYPTKENDNEEEESDSELSSMSEENASDSESNSSEPHPVIKSEQMNGVKDASPI